MNRRHSKYPKTRPIEYQLSTPWPSAEAWNPIKKKNYQTWKTSHITKPAEASKRGKREKPCGHHSVFPMCIFTRSNTSGDSGCKSTTTTISSSRSSSSSGSIDPRAIISAGNIRPNGNSCCWSSRRYRSCALIDRNSRFHRLLLGVELPGSVGFKSWKLHLTEGDCYANRNNIYRGGTSGQWKQQDIEWHWANKAEPGIISLWLI